MASNPEIEEMYCLIDEQDGSGDCALKMHCCEILYKAGYRNVESILKEFAEKLKAEFFFIKTTANKNAIYQFTDSGLDRLVTKFLKENR